LAARCRVRLQPSRGRPRGGDVIPGTGGFRKVLWADRRRGKGKRRGLRVICYYISTGAQIWLMTLYDKGEAADLSAAEKRLLKAALHVELAQRPAHPPAETVNDESKKETTRGSEEATPLPRAHGSPLDPDTLKRLVAGGVRLLGHRPAERQIQRVARPRNHSSSAARPTLFESYVGSQLRGCELPQPILPSAFPPATREAAFGKRSLR
jgi:hypothetical protein